MNYPRHGEDLPSLSLFRRRRGCRALSGQLPCPPRGAGWGRCHWPSRGDSATSGRTAPCHLGMTLLRKEMEKWRRLLRYDWIGFGYDDWRIDEIRPWKIEFCRSLQPSKKRLLELGLGQLGHLSGTRSRGRDWFALFCLSPLWVAPFKNQSSITKPNLNFTQHIPWFISDKRVNSRSHESFNESEGFELLFWELVLLLQR